MALSGDDGGFDLLNFLGTLWPSSCDHDYLTDYWSIGLWQQ
jgi:hypothetical protein